MMRVKSQVCIPQSVVLCLFLFSVSAVSGCQGFRGARVPPPSQVSLVEQDTGKGILQTEDVAIFYHYDRDGDTVRISGEGQLYRRGVRYFNLSLFFLDAEGRVMESTALLNAVMGGPISFQTRKSVPPGSQSFAFGYRGESIIRELGGIPFWYYPFDE